MENYFSLFELSEIFDIDVKVLEKKYFELQRNFHPDKFTGRSDKEKIAAIHKASEINEGYKVLKNPLSRAEYLLSLLGISDIKPSQELLMEALEQREELSTAENYEDIKTIENKNNESRNTILSEISQRFLDGDFKTASQLTIKLKYLEKFAEEIRLRKTKGNLHAAS